MKLLSFFAAAHLSLILSLSAEETVKVFVLAGQSNMEGKVQRKLLDYQAAAPETRELFTHLRDENGWITREDVFIKYLGEHGGLTVGYGSGDRTGVELEFGTVLGEAMEAPVLLIKTAWGGHSLVKDFRPPSAGLPPAETLEAEWENARKQTTKNNEERKREDPLPTMADIKAGYGKSYRNMIGEVRGTMSDYATLFPELKGKRLELDGFVWFQGWNDQYQGAEKEYASNMEHLIRDIRKDLSAPVLPVVIGVMGQNGSTPAKGPMLVIQEAQMAMEKVPDFQGNVKAVRTDLLVDKAAEELYPRWKDNTEAWEKVGSDHGYHYLGSAIWHLRMGRAFAEAMLKMQ